MRSLEYQLITNMHFRVGCRGARMYVLIDGPDVCVLAEKQAL